jgi:uncharacterized protein (TIGR02271 family)
MIGTENIDAQERKIANDAIGNQQQVVSTIPIVQETFQVRKEVVETNKIHISKKITEHQTDVDIPLITEEYDIVRVPINQVVAKQPEAMRQQGDTMIISVVKEVLVVEKKYEIIEEVHITKKVTEKSETQHIILRQEEVHIEKTPVIRQENNA